MNPSPLCPHLNSNLEDIKESILHNWDWVQVNWGIEGAGKSKFSLYANNYMDDNFSIDNVVFDNETISDTISVCHKGDAVLIDEGGEWLFNRNWNTKESKEILQTLFVIRQKGLFIWINVPDIEVLDVYVRSGRLRSGTKAWTYPVWVNKEDGSRRKYRERGLFNFYSRKSILQYFKKGYYLKPSFTEHYPDVETLEGGKQLWKDYTDKKNRWLAVRNKKKEEKLSEDKQVVKNVRRIARGIKGNLEWLGATKRAFESEYGIEDNGQPDSKSGELPSVPFDTSSGVL